MTYPSRLRWLEAGFDRFPLGTLAALIISWTGALIGLWGAAIGAIVALFVYVLVIVFHVPLFGAAIHIPFFGNPFPETGWPTTLLGAVAVIALGALAGFLWVYAGAILTAPSQAIAALVIGGLIAAVIVVTYGAIEQPILNLRGYRRPSRDEARRLAPLVENAADALGLGTIPTFAISDERIPTAAAYTKTICLSRSLLQTLEDSELRAIIAHELAHWKNADVIGKLYVLAAGWPVIFLYEFGTWLVGQGTVLIPAPLGSRAGQGGSLVSDPASQMTTGLQTAARGLFPFIGRLIAFPAFLLVNFVLIPVMAAESRRTEYQADAAVKAAGLGSPLAAALRKLELFEPGRTGWERRLAMTHPPMELRIEALQPSKSDDAIYQQPELGAIGWGRLFDIAVALVVIALAIIAVIVAWNFLTNLVGR